MQRLRHRSVQLPAAAIPDLMSSPLTITTSILHALGDLVLILDHEQRVTAAYGMWIQTARFDPSQFVGKTIADEWPADLAALHIDMNARALDGQVVVYDWEFPLPGSGQRMVTWLCPLYAKSGEIGGAVRVSREVGEHVRALVTQAVQLALRQPSKSLKTTPHHTAQRSQPRADTPSGPPRQAQCSANITSLIHRFSARERRIVMLLLDSSRTSQIAQELKISVHTVRQHVKHILKKAEVHSQQELLDVLRGKRRS
jgi:DNA-binding CsgD family transcriptional regulator